jgi:RNA polymerase sigma factor (sigma-70 family)
MTNEPDDNALVEGCLGGDEHAFEILVTRYQGPIYNAVLRMVRDRDDASDLTQNAFLKAFQQLSRFDPQYKFFSWLYRIAINESLNFVKRSSRQEPLESDGVASDRRRSRSRPSRAGRSDENRSGLSCGHRLEAFSRLLVRRDGRDPGNSGKNSQIKTF